MNNHVLSVAASIFITFGLGIGLIGVASVNAQIPEIPGMPSTISGAYLNTEAGVEIMFPDGWEGMEISVQGSTIATVYLGGLAGVTGEGMPAAMTLIVSNKSEVQEPDPSEPQNVPEDSTVHCEPATVSNVNVAGVTAMQSVIECTVDGAVIKSKTVMVDTEARWIVLSFMAPSAQYDQNINAADNSIATLRVNGAIDAESIPGGSVVIEMNPIVRSVSIAGENMDVSIRSSSTISEFQLDEDSKRLSFMVDGQDGTEGATEIVIGKILEGPYTVTIDGQTMTNFEVTNAASGEAVITVSYTHSVHEITITGTNVVPEFPVAVIGIVGAIIGAVAILSRTKFMNAFSGHRP